MADVTDWQQRAEYYCAGLGGPTICRVFAQNRWQYEVWAANGTPHGMEPSPVAAIVPPRKPRQSLTSRFFAFAVHCATPLRHRSHGAIASLAACDISAWARGMASVI